MPARLKVLSELTHAFAEATPNLEALHDTIALKLSSVVRDGCGLLLLSDDERELRVVSMHASSAELVRASRQVLSTRPMKVDENPHLAQVLHSGEPLVFSRAASSSQSSGLVSAYEVVSRAFGVHSRLTVALRLRGKPIGLLNMIRYMPESPAFDDRDVELLQVLADNAALAITNARSYAAERAARLAAEGAEQQLREYQDSLRRMAFEAAVAEERERHRLAALLHDGVGQELTLAQLKLTAMRQALSGQSLAELDEALDILAKSTRDCSNLTFELSPPLLYDLGMNAALSWLSEELAVSRNLHVALADDGQHKPLDETTAAIVFRAVRELLINVSKHAAVTEAAVLLRRIEDDLELVVEDGGVGFRLEETRPGMRGHGFGLLSVREQIDRLGGTFEITSSLGSGTRALLRVPLLASSVAGTSSQAHAGGRR